MLEKVHVDNCRKSDGNDRPMARNLAVYTRTRMNQPSEGEAGEKVMQLLSPGIPNQTRIDCRWTTTRCKLLHHV